MLFKAAGNLEEKIQAEDGSYSKWYLAGQKIIQVNVGKEESLAPNLNLSVVKSESSKRLNFK